MTAMCIDIISNSSDDISFKTMKLQISSCFLSRVRSRQSPARERLD
jgi:hypothetical protein